MSTAKDGDLEFQAMIKKVQRYEALLNKLGIHEHCESKYFDEGGPPLCYEEQHCEVDSGGMFCEEALQAFEQRIDRAIRLADYGSRPKIVCLCGSTKFEYAFECAAKSETLAGNIVLSVGIFCHRQGEVVPEDVKNRLDELHMAKIRLADEILVLNVGGYIGDSTLREVDYAMEIGKPVRWLTKMSIQRGTVYVHDECPEYMIKE